MKANATTNKVNEIVTRGYITEKEINLLKNRVNNDRASISELDDLGGMRITIEQTAKGLTWLIDKWKTQRGTERKNNPFGYREQDILENFDHFELAGFYNASDSYNRAFYVPLYDVCAKDGRHFEYYVWGGEVQIVG